jgi:hypothetical protein
MVCATRNFENTEDNNKEWHKSDVCKVGFQNMTDQQTLSMWLQNKSMKKRVGRRREKFILP